MCPASEEGRPVDLRDLVPIAADHDGVALEEGYNPRYGRGGGRAALGELLNTMASSRAKQIAWADGLSLGAA